jgi:hypothetical protein
VIEPGGIVFHKASGERMYVKNFQEIITNDLEDRLQVNVIRSHVDPATNQIRYFSTLFSFDELETFEGRELRELESLKYLQTVVAAEELTVN